MAESALSVDYAKLRRSIANVLNWKPDPGDWSTDQTARGDDMIDQALQQFYLPPPLSPGRPSHQWSFLYPVTTISTVAQYNTGTITVVAGVVTLTVAGTFPSWAANGELTVDGITYTVNTLDNDNQLTLDDLTIAADELSTYTLAQPAYDLPDDFGAIEGPLTFRPGTSSCYGPIRLLGTYEDLAARRQGYDITSRPQIAVLVPKAFDPTVGQRTQIHFWPTPDAVYQLWYRYRINPEDLSDSNKYPLGGMVHAETIRASCMAIAEQYMNDERGVQYQHFLERLAASVSHDQQATTPNSLGVDRGHDYLDDTDADLYYHGGVSYEGHTLLDLT